MTYQGRRDARIPNKKAAVGGPRDSDGGRGAGYIGHSHSVCVLLAQEGIQQAIQACRSDRGGKRMQ